MSFYLAVRCIDTNYTGPLTCFTVVFTPIGTVLGIVLTAIVGKNKAENTKDGINYLKVSGDEI